jgi:hypothetical protein
MWFEGNYRRIFLDMHIDDSNEEYLSRINPGVIVEVLKNAGAQQILVKAKPHTGLCYWPCVSEAGRMHKGLKGRDYVGEMIKLCHKNDIAVMTYFSQIFDNWAYEQNPSWRCVNVEGRTSREYEDYKNGSMFKNGRYGIVCPNNEGYRKYVKTALNDLTGKYDFESIFLDMPFWPEICYCSSCKERYYKQTGREMPKTVDWNNPEWLNFQRIREEWMGEFAVFSACCVKEINRHVTIEHNMALAPMPWAYASTDLIVDACDYVGGDLYGGYLQQTFICKYYKNLTPNLPFVYITSRCDPDLKYHTTTKTEEELLLHAITALVHNGAFSICDGVNPDGTICEEVYDSIIKNVFDKTKDYENIVSGNLFSNVSVWFSTNSKFDMELCGLEVSEITGFGSQDNEYINNPLKFAALLREDNMPFEVIPSRKLKDLNDNLLAICNVAFIRDEEMTEIEKYLANGGNVYISGRLGHQRLAELLEVEYLGCTEHDFTYMSPTETGAKYFEGFSSKFPMSVDGRMHMVRMKGNADVLATLTLPYTMTGQREYSAIHSNPPGIHTKIPAAIRKKAGKGNIFWVGAPIENTKPYMGKRVVLNIIQELAGEKKFSSNAPASVEVIGWEKNGKKYFAAINQQETMPIMPIYDIRIELPYKINGARLAVGGTELKTAFSDKKTIIELPKLDIFMIIELY